MYRVRRSWAEASSQVGAYNVLANAQAMANIHPGYSVYDEAGNAVYTSINSPVKTMEYKAKLLKAVEGHAKGTKVRVTRDRQKRWVITTDGIVVPKKSYIDLQKQWYDNTVRYDKATAEAWINATGVKSETEWLFWANKWGQRAYIFRGSKGAWALQKVVKCGTGNIAYGDGSDQGVGFGWKIYDKCKAYQGPQAVQYYNQHYSSAWGNSIHKGPAGYPCTHGCISLKKSAAIWVYNNLPVDTRVVVF